MNKYNVGSVGPSEGLGDCVQSPRLLALITSLSALMLQVFVMPLFGLGLTVVPCLRMFCVFVMSLFALIGLTELSHEGCLKTKLPGEKSGGWGEERS